MDFYEKTITQKTNMEVEINEVKDVAELTQPDRLTAAINSINMANEMLRDNQNKVEMEIMRDVIPLALLIKVKTQSVESVIIIKHEIQELVRDNLPRIKGHKMYLYRYEAKLKDGSVEYYFHQTYFDRTSDFQKRIIEDVFREVTLEFVGDDANYGKNYNRETFSYLMEQ